MHTPAVPGAPVRFCVAEPLLDVMIWLNRSARTSRILTVEPLEPPGKLQQITNARCIYADTSAAFDLQLDTGSLPRGTHTLRIRVRLEDARDGEKRPVRLLDTIVDRVVEIADDPIQADTITTHELDARVDACCDNIRVWTGSVTAPVTVITPSTVPATAAPGSP